MTFLGFDRRDAAMVWNFFRMFLRDRFLGSRLGGVWAVLSPLLLLATYTYVFGFVFKSRLPGSDSTLAYVVWLIAGYAPWLAIAEAFSLSASTIVGNGGLVKNMAFKTECLPIASVMMGFIPLAVGISFVLLLMLVDGNLPTWHALAIVPAALMMFAFLAAVGVGFAALSIFVRDFTMILPTILLAALFASPVFYPIEFVPSVLRVAANWNPLYLMAESIRKPLVYHEFLPLGRWVYMIALTTAIALFNLHVFRRVKGDFASML